MVLVPSIVGLGLDLDSLFIVEDYTSVFKRFSSLAVGNGRFKLRECGSLKTENTIMRSNAT